MYSRALSAVVAVSPAMHTPCNTHSNPSSLRPPTTQAPSNNASPHLECHPHPITHTPTTHAPCHSSPSLCGQTDACENITFPQLLLRKVTMIVT